MPVPSKAQPVPIALEPAEPLRQQCLHFLDCVRTGARPRTDGREGLRVLRVLARASEELMKERGETPAPAVAALPSGRVPKPYPGVQIHETVYVDRPVEIGEGTKIWHFSHILGGVRIGRNVTIGQNVMVGPDVIVGDTLQDPEQRQPLQGRHARGGRVLRAVLRLHQRQQSACRDRAQERVPRRPSSGAARRSARTRPIVCGHTIGAYCLHRRGRGGDGGRAGLRADGRRAGDAHRLGESCRRQAWAPISSAPRPGAAIARPRPNAWRKSPDGRAPALHRPCAPSARASAPQSTRRSCASSTTAATSWGRRSRRSRRSSRPSAARATSSPARTAPTRSPWC